MITPTNSDLNEEPLQIKPHQPRYMTPLCHGTAFSVVDDLLNIHTSTDMDINLKTLVDSGAKKKCSDSYVREKLLITHYSLPFKPSSYPTCRWKYEYGKIRRSH